VVVIEGMGTGLHAVGLRATNHAADAERCGNQPGTDVEVSSPVPSNRRRAEA
jgi:hypothetical protein